MTTSHVLCDYNAVRLRWQMIAMHSGLYFYSENYMLETQTLGCGFGSTFVSDGIGHKSRSLRITTNSRHFSGGHTNYEQKPTTATTIPTKIFCRYNFNVKNTRGPTLVIYS